MESADEGKRLSPPCSSLPTSSDSLHSAAAAASESPETTTSQKKPDKDNVNKTDLDPGLNQTSPVGDGRISASDSRTSPATSPDHLGEANKGENFNHSISEGSEAFELATNASPNSQAGSDYTDSDFLGPTGSMPKNPQREIDDLDSSPAATQSPPTQVMERPGDPASSPYRIPDYVFARNKSTAPLEWSTASNESLFSIHMGNMSFTREQFPWLGKSGELGLPGDVNMMMPPPGSPLHTIDFTSNQPPSKQQPSEYQQPPKKSSGNLNEQPSPRVAEEKAAETMRQVIMEEAEKESNHEADKPHSFSPVGVEGKKFHETCLSHCSDGSTKSFAFPILAGDGDVSASLRGDAMKQKNHSPSKPRSPRDSRPQTPTETPTSQSQTPKSETTNVAKCRWGIPCFSCCPSCC